ncbi:MAG: SEC-C domain-containing protein [Deltaproteobacteria bacterium]|nr:SEC-C domain-containing protein [Deltaproteobacteria bacterium]
MFEGHVDPHSARIVLTVSLVANTLECFDDLDVDLQGSPRKHAEGVLKIMGPAAVFTAILQAAPPLQESDRVGGFVDVFVDAATRRREDLIASLPADLRERVLAHEMTRSVPPSRVVEFFQQALADSKLPGLMQRWTDMTAVDRMAERVSEVQSRTDTAGALDPEEVAAIPKEALAGLGSALAAAGIDEDALARVLDGVLPPDAPAGYSHDGAGTLRREKPKTGRNAPCHCGSGRKYKKCHGRA